MSSVRKTTLPSSQSPPSPYGYKAVSLQSPYDYKAMHQSPFPCDYKAVSSSSTPSPSSVIDGFRRMSIGDKTALKRRDFFGGDVSDESSPMSTVMESDQVWERIDPNRVSLPKSISVRSKGYLKPVVQGSGTSEGGDPVRVQNRVGTGRGTQKVYIRGVEKEEQPLELQVYNQGTSKTELCNKWQQSGACPYGDNCQFAHGVEELRPVLRHPRYKTEVCRMVLAGDHCPYGHRCHFRHSLTDEEKLMARTMKMQR